MATPALHPWSNPLSQFQLKFVRVRWVTSTTELTRNPRTAWPNWIHINSWFGVLMGSWVLIAVYTGQSVSRDFDRACYNTSVWLLNQCAEITIQNVAVLWLNTVTDIITHEFGCEWFVILTSIEVHRITTVHTKGLTSILSPFLQGHTDRSNTEPVHSYTGMSYIELAQGHYAGSNTESYCHIVGVPSQATTGSNNWVIVQSPNSAIF